MNWQTRLLLILGGTVGSVALDKMDEGHWVSMSIGVLLIVGVLYLTSKDRVIFIPSQETNEVDGSWQSCHQKEPHPFHVWVTGEDRYRRCAGVLPVPRHGDGYEWHGVDGV